MPSVANSIDSNATLSCSQPIKSENAEYLYRIKNCKNKLIQHTKAYGKVNKYGGCRSTSIAV